MGPGIVFRWLLRVLRVFQGRGHFYLLHEFTSSHVLSLSEMSSQDLVFVGVAE
jgi:hypothetical protein